MNLDYNMEEQKVQLKECKTCKQFLPLINYYKEPKSKDKLFYSCKNCCRKYRNDLFKNKTKEQKEEHNKRNRIQYSKNRNRKAELVKKRRQERPELFKNASLKYHFGINIDTYNKILEDQNFSCAICKSHISKFKKSFSVDHCHKTGKIRGLLCNKCNLGIGHLNDSIEILKNSIIYLEKHI